MTVIGKTVQPFLYTERQFELTFGHVANCIVHISVGINERDWWMTQQRRKVVFAAGDFCTLIGGAQLR